MNDDLMPDPWIDTWIDLGGKGWARAFRSRVWEIQTRRRLAGGW